MKSIQISYIYIYSYGVMVLMLYLYFTWANEMHIPTYLHTYIHGHEYIKKKYPKPWHIDTYRAT